MAYTVNDCTVSDIIKAILHERKMTATDLAKKLETSRSNVSNKFARNNFSDKEMRDIANALNCSYRVTFTMKDTGVSYSSDK